MRIYDITHEAVSMTAAIQTIIEFSAPATKSCLVLRAWLSQSGSTTSAQQAVTLLRKATAATNVTAPNAIPKDAGDTAFGGTVRGLCTAGGSLGVDLVPDAFNWVNGWVWLPTPNEWIAVPGAGIVGLYLPVAPAALTISAGITVAEIG